jgi:hypothetical protein
MFVIFMAMVIMSYELFAGVPKLGHGKTQRRAPQNGTRGVQIGRNMLRI